MSLISCGISWRCSSFPSVLEHGCLESLVATGGHVWRRAVVLSGCGSWVRARAAVLCAPRGGCEGTVVSGVRGRRKGTGPERVAVPCMGAGPGLPCPLQCEALPRCARPHQAGAGAGRSPSGRQVALRIAARIALVSPAAGQGNSSSGQPPPAGRKGERVGRRQAEELFQE